MVFAQGHLFFLMCCERSMEVWHLHQVWKCFDLFLELGEAENLRCFLAPVAWNPMANIREETIAFWCFLAVFSPRYRSTLKNLALNHQFWNSWTVETLFPHRTPRTCYLEFCQGCWREWRDQRVCNFHPILDPGLRWYRISHDFFLWLQEFSSTICLIYWAQLLCRDPREHPINLRGWRAQVTRWACWTWSIQSPQNTHDSVVWTLFVPLKGFKLHESTFGYGSKLKTWVHVQYPSTYWGT